MAADLFKLQSYQRTQQLIRDVNFENAVALPLAAGAEDLKLLPQNSSNSWMINRIQTSIAKNDMTLVGHTLRDLTDILEYRAKNLGEKPESNPLYSFYERLRNRAESGRVVSWEELTNALNTFSADKENLTVLQDTINNEKLNSSKPGNSPEEVEKIPVTTTKSTSENLNPQSPPLSDIQLYTATPEAAHPEESHNEEHESHSSETEQTKKRELPEQTQNKLNQASRSMRQAQANPPPLESPDNLQSSLENKLNRFSKSMRRTQPSRDALLNSRTRKKAAASLLNPGTSSTSSGLAGAASNYLGFRDLINGSRWLADKMGLRSLSNFLGRFLAHENLIARALQGLWNLGSNFVRSIFDGLVRSLVPRAGGVFSGAGSTIGGWFSSAGAFFAGGVGATMALFLTIVLGAFALYLLQQKEFEDCGKAGSVTIQKQADKESYSQGETIKYELLISYNLNCLSATIDNVEVRDQLPTGSTPIESSYEAIGLNPQDPAGTSVADPLGQSDPLDPNDSGVNPDLLDQNPNNLEASNIKPTLVNNTLIWKIGTISPNSPIVLKFAVTAPNEDTWAINQASVSYREVSTALGSGNVPNGGDEPSSQDTCGGTYKLHPVYGNFGDPSCNFTKEGLYALLKQSDPAEADYWFTTVVRKESSYIPNAFNSNSTSGLGAFGLFQMNPLGKGNTQYDAGNVAWQRQTSNAINYNNFLSTLGRTWCYWEAAHERWPAICRQ